MENRIHIESSTVRLAGDGVELTADIFGSEEAPPVLLLHGGGQTRHAWSNTGKALAAAGWRAIALDLRGHGDSDWPESGEYDPEHFAADLQVVIRELGRPPAVVGASLGGMMALTAQRLSKTQLYSAVVLVDITPRMERVGVERIVGFMLAHPDGFGSLEAAADAIAAYRPNKPRPADPSGLERTLRQTPDGRWHWRWDARFLTTKFQASQDGVEALDSRRESMEERLLAGARRVEVPTLLVRGALSDLVSPEGASAFLNAVPHADYVDVENAGHMVSGDQNDAFTTAVIDFLKGTPRDSS
ncbi:MAG: alpha/beta hydrolase [Deltaproteobacteria bacterium]|nr:alpha/beta hydrolase [Deltaproteobacteria bacterium]